MRKIICTLLLLVSSFSALAQDIWTMPANFNNLSGGQYYTSTYFCEGGVPGMIVFWVDGIYPRSRCAPYPGMTVVAGVPTFAAAGAADWLTMTNKPMLGNAASLDKPSTGNATAVQVVLGSDTRLTDARTPTAHTHPSTQISDSTAAGRAILTAADASAIRGLISVPSISEVAATYFVKPAGSSAQYLDGTGALRTSPVINRVRATTATDGTYVWTLPTPCAAGALPAVALTPENGTSGEVINHKLTAVSNSSVSLSLSRAVLTLNGLLGLTIPIIQTSPGAQVVHLIAICP